MSAFYADLEAAFRMAQAGKDRLDFGTFAGAQVSACGVYFSDADWRGMVACRLKWLFGLDWGLAQLQSSY